MAKRSGRQKRGGPSQALYTIYNIQSQRAPASRVSVGPRLLALNGTTQCQPMLHPSNKSD